MTFGLLLLSLWPLAWAALVLFIFSVCWLGISSLWHLSRKQYESLEKMSVPSRPGEPEPYAMPPKKLTVTQIAKMMLWAAVVLGAYDVGIQREKADNERKRADALAKYAKEHAGWQQKDAAYDKDHAAFQEAVAKWKAKQKENR